LAGFHIVSSKGSNKQKIKQKDENNHKAKYNSILQGKDDIEIDIYNRTKYKARIN